MLIAQQVAPCFNSLNQNNETIQLDDFKTKKNIVLYFYPKDNTPGCTIQANEFTALAAEFSALHTVIIGVSKDSCDSHRGFIEKQGLTIDLLADITGKVCEDYGVWQEKDKNGVKKMGIVRSTFIINKNGIVESAQYNVTAKGHALTILEQVKAL